MKVTILFFLMIAFGAAGAQQPDDAADYVKAIANAQVPMNSKYMEFMSALAHQTKNVNIKDLRKEVIEKIKQSLERTKEIGPYKGDNSLRQSSIDYITLCNVIFNDDYSRIVNAKEVEEQSYNEMQAVVLMQEKAAKKLIDKSLELTNTNAAFAEKYKVKLLDSRDKLNDKLAVAARLNHYRNQVFLIFYKCNWQYNQVVKAIDDKKLNDIEQGRNGLIRYANDGMQQLSNIGPFEDDPSLAFACNGTLSFYKHVAETQVPQFTAFLLQEENYNKIKKSYLRTPAKNHTAEEAATFKKETDKYTAAINDYNRVNDLATSNRKIVLQNWSMAESRFVDKHMPHYK